MKYLFFTILTIIASLGVLGQPITRETNINLTSGVLEATPVPVLFPYNGGTGFFTVTTSTTASYTLTKTDNVNLTSESVTPTGSGQTIKVEYAIPPATLPGKAAITVTVAGYASQTLPINIAGKGAMTSAASFSPGKIAHGALATFWGANLAQTTQATSLPLPTTLGGLSIYRQAFGTNELTACPLLYVSLSQVNLLLPDSDNYGMFIFYSLNAAGDYYSEYVAVNALAPDVFTVNSNGNEYDHAALTIQRNDSGTAVYEAPTLRLNQNNQWIIDPIRLTPETYLLFYSSGARKDISLTSCYAILDDTVNLPLTYAGPQGYYAGLDQIAVKLPTTTASGTHKIQFVVNGWRSNPVRIPI
ncbi:MAG: hypothetical protein JST84_05350 [Acidobacteria bacterium]|nr:hypothetical protein [Acidobacteriota bacterium]